MKPRLTEQVQSAWLPYLKKARSAIDATCGNGHDTLFIAGHLAPGSCLLAIDIQAIAVEKSRQRLESEPNPVRVHFHHGSHHELAEVSARIPQFLPTDLIVFNLGYLPGGDHTLTTESEGTAEALQIAWHLLKTGGLLSVVAYRGHPGGEAEYQCVKEWMENLPLGKDLHKIPTANNGPVAFLAEKP